MSTAPSRRSWSPLVWNLSAARSYSLSGCSRARGAGGGERPRNLLWAPPRACFGSRAGVSTRPPEECPSSRNATAGSHHRHRQGQQREHHDHGELTAGRSSPARAMARGSHGCPGHDPGRARRLLPAETTRLAGAHDRARSFAQHTGVRLFRIARQSNPGASRRAIRAVGARTATVSKASIITQRPAVTPPGVDRRSQSSRVSDLVGQLVWDRSASGR